MLREIIAGVGRRRLATDIVQRLLTSADGYVALRLFATSAPE